MTDDAIRRRVTVHGRVQGVFFRDTCRQIAEEHGVSGWVRNLPDGRVEAVFEGLPEAVDALVAWCHEGPPAARVDEVRVTPVDPTGLDRGFQVGTTG